MTDNVKKAKVVIDTPHSVSIDSFDYNLEFDDLCLGKGYRCLEVYFKFCFLNSTNLYKFYTILASHIRKFLASFLTDLSYPL